MLVSTILQNTKINMANYNTYTLDNGLRIIHKPSVAEVVYCGYQIAAGTRDELPGEEGMAHFCEHLTLSLIHISEPTRPY